MNVLRIAEDSLRLTWKHKALWFFGFFVAAGSGSGGGDSSSASAAGGPGAIAGSVAAGMPAWLPWAIGGAVLLGLAVMVMHVISEGALIEGCARARDGEETHLRQGMRDGLGSFWAVLKVKLTLFGVALVTVPVLASPVLLHHLELIPLAAAIALGIVALLLAIPLFITLYLIYAVALRYVVLDNRHAWDAMRRARLFLHGRLIESLLLLLAVGVGQIGAGIAMLALMIPIGALGVAAYFLGGLPSAIVVASIIGVPLAIAVVSALGTYQSSVWTLGYLEARASEA